MIKVGFKKLTDDAILPAKAHLTDSGFDLFANETVTILPGGRRYVLEHKDQFKGVRK